MAVPKRKTSKARRDQRRTHYKLTAPNLVPCPNCRELRLQHRVCPHCGHYRDTAIISSEDD